jgi:hypothetical protein
MSEKRFVIVGAILGAFGAWFGFIVGSGIADAWHGVLLGIFISIFSLMLFASEVPIISIDRYRELIVGLLVGLAAEISVVRSIYIAIVLGAIAGYFTASTTQNLRPYSAEIRARYYPIIRLTFGILVMVIIIASLIWAYPRGILKDVAIVSLVILLPILILAFGGRYRSRK